jgi:hypothetical protein
MLRGQTSVHGGNSPIVIPFETVAAPAQRARSRVDCTGREHGVRVGWPDDGGWDRPAIVGTEPLDLDELAEETYSVPSRAFLVTLHRKEIRAIKRLNEEGR